MQAAFGGDAKSIKELIHPRELEHLGMTADQATRALDRVIATRMSRFSASNSARAPITEGDYHAVFYTVRCDGGEFASGVEVFQTSNGPKMSISLLALQALRGIEEQGKLSHDPNWTTDWNAMVSDLHSVGIKGYFDLGSGSFDAWPTYDKAGNVIPGRI